MKTLEEFGLNGFAALDYVLRATYGNFLRAVAQLSLFSHPDTVRQTRNEALFRVKRAGGTHLRGKALEEEQLLLCDNRSPQLAFLWANNLTYTQFKDVQFNHIYSSNDPVAYTSLANLCITPAFVAKLTDTNLPVKQLLRYRVWELYNFVPPGFSIPQEPNDYSKLTWASTLPPTQDVALAVEERMKRSARSRPALATARFGWLLSNQNVEKKKDDGFSPLIQV